MAAIIFLTFVFTLGASNKYHVGAWNILLAGMHDRSAGRRAEAVSCLDLLADDPRAIPQAEQALNDPSSGVKVAAVNALGDLNARSSLPRIKALASSADGKMLLTIAAVLKKFNDSEGNKIFYEILTGTRKTGGGILSGIKDRKSIERMGIEEAIGFVPFGGIGLGAYDYFKQNGSSKDGMLALTALSLANDPDPATEKALVDASFNNADPVKVAALRALANAATRR